MEEKIAAQKNVVEELEKNLEPEKKKLSEMIIEHQKSCPHEKKEKVFVRMEDRTDKLEILRGHHCEDCDLFIPSKVYDRFRPRLDKYCVRCDGEVKFDGRTGTSYNCDREFWYKCTVCGHGQKEFVG